MLTRKTDLDIRNDVLRELAWDSRIGDRQIGVQVDDGVVTLGGTVDSLATRNAAAEAAHQVACVKDVANELQVATVAHLTDTDIARAVRHALEWDALLPDQEIRSTVGGGMVVLEGVVATPIQREEAEGAIGRLKGVKGIDNRLQIRRLSEPDAVEASIRQALNRRAVREADRIRVRVGDGGQVVVEGIVHSAEERSTVLGAIRGTGGVQRIEDRLCVESTAPAPPFLERRRL
jgi:osmotically-inducible protein OsmY